MRDLKSKVPGNNYSPDDNNDLADQSMTSNDPMTFGDPRSGHARKPTRHQSYDMNNGKARTTKRGSSPTLSPTSQSVVSSNDEVTSTVNLNSSLTSLSYSTAAFSNSFPSSSTTRSLCFVCLDKPADSSLPVNKEFVKEYFPNFSKDVHYHRGVCSKCYRKLTELETLQSFKQFCDLMFEEAKSELEQLFDLSRHTRMLLDFEQQEQFRKCLTNAPETNLIGSLQVDDEQLSASFNSRQRANRSTNTIDSDNNTGSSPISSAGDGSSSSKKDSSPIGATGSTTMPSPGNASWVNGNSSATRRKHKTHSSKQQPGRTHALEDEEAAYFGSQSSTSGLNEDSGGVATNAHTEESARSFDRGGTDSLGFLEGLALRGLTNLSSSLSVASQNRKLSPFQNLSSSFDLHSANNGSRVNLNLQLAETLIKDAIRTASFDAGYTEVDFSNVSVDLCVDSSNANKPIQLNLTHKSPSSCDTTPVRSFAEPNGDLLESEPAVPKTTNRDRFGSEKVLKKCPNIESNPLNNPLHIDASIAANHSKDAEIDWIRNSSADSLKTTSISVGSSVSPSSGISNNSQSIHLTNRNRFYQFKSKDQPIKTADETAEKPSQSDSNSRDNAAANSVQIPSKLSSGTSLTTSTSSTSISKLRMPNIKSSHQYLNDQEEI